MVSAAALALAGAGCEGEELERVPDKTYLQTKDHQVECELAFEYLRCLALDARWEPPPSAPECAPPELPTVQLDRGNQPARFTCWAGVPPPKRDAPLHTLAGGSGLWTGEFSCKTDRRQLSCTSHWWTNESESSRNAFVISRVRLKLSDSAG